MSHFYVAAPYCAKCKKPVSVTGLAQHPINQSFTLSYTCHDVTTRLNIARQDLANMSSNALIDFVEFSRVANDGQNLHT